jgi:hypothetical protein
MNASLPIKAEAIIPVGVNDVAGIPTIALVIPDFEGSATLRFFANSTQTEIGCFRARMQNGATLGYPEAIGPTLGVFAIIAIAASFATAIYGVSIPAIRTHYGHSLSVLVVFEVFHHIFFSGALSVDWPSVCAAWWSNFAWSAGMIYSPAMTNSINHFIGANQGNSSQVGGAGSTPLNSNGGLQQIYGRSYDDTADNIYSRSINGLTTAAFNAITRGHTYESRLAKRATGGEMTNRTSKGYSWAGNPIEDGLPLPGNWSGLSGTLSDIGIPASNAFMTGFLWFLILLAIIAGLTVAFKWMLEGLSRLKWIRFDRLALFRSHWTGFLAIIVLRTMMIAFFMMLTLTFYQFSIGGGAGPLAIAAIVFVIFFVGLLGIAGYACFYRLRFGKFESGPDIILVQHRKVMKVIPWIGFSRHSTTKEPGTSIFELPFFKIRHIDDNPARQSVHEDQAFIKRFGWLTAHFRRTRWWFFAVWLVYQFIRACFVGGASKNPTAQVFGLFVVEIIAFIVIVSINPFEGSRNTVLAVYLLSISKIVTAGLSAAFLPQYNLPRIPTTVVGFIIVITQALLVIALMILIVLGAISSYMSLTRNREEFKPHSLENIRFKYFNHLEMKAPDVPPPIPEVPVVEEPKEPKEPYFNVNSVRRAPKIEDEDDFVGDIEPNASYISLTGRQSGRQSRADSMRSQHSAFGSVPYGARVHRASWSSRDFAKWEQEGLSSLDGSPARGSRQISTAYTNHTSHTSTSMQPLVRPPAVLGNNSRPATPTREELMKHRSERVGASPSPIGSAV